MKRFMKFNELIKKEELKNLTQQEVADKIGISRNYLSDIENGRYNPSFKRAIQLGYFT